LAELKTEGGFICIIYGGKEFTKGYYLVSGRSRSCRYDESGTTHDLFHHLKLGLAKDFYAVSRHCKKKNVLCRVSQGSEHQPAQSLVVNYKFQQTFESGVKHSLTGEGDRDELVTGEPERAAWPIRWTKEKTLVMVEIRGALKPAGFIAAQPQNTQKRL
jgi:hypothetical protein